MPLVEYDWSLDEPASIVGQLDSGGTVSIELWSEGNAQTLVSDECTEIDDTGYYSWSLSNLGSLSGSRVQYHWRMTDAGSGVAEGDFIVKSIEGNDGFMPSTLDFDSYIMRIEEL